MDQISFAYLAESNLIYEHKRRPMPSIGVATVSVWWRMVEAEGPVN